jgi:hypothetical protein
MGCAQAGLAGLRDLIDRSGEGDEPRRTTYEPTMYEPTTETLRPLLLGID